MPSRHHSFTLMLGIALVIPGTVVSGQRDTNKLPQLNPRVTTYNWRVVDARMSPRDYHDATDDNRHTAAEAAGDIADRKLRLMGVPESVATVTGSTAQLAVAGGRYSLNEAETLLLELSELVDDDRTMLLRWPGLQRHPGEV